MEPLSNTPAYVEMKDFTRHYQRPADGMRVLAGLRNVLQLQRSRSDFRHGGGAGMRVVTLSALSDDLGDRREISAS